MSLYYLLKRSPRIPDTKQILLEVTLAQTTEAKPHLRAGNYARRLLRISEFSVAGLIHLLVHTLDALGNLRIVLNMPAFEQAVMSRDHWLVAKYSYELCNAGYSPGALWRLARAAAPSLTHDEWREFLSEAQEKFPMI